METRDQVRERVKKKLGELDGVVALRRTAEGTAPCLFREGDDLSELVLSPRYPMSTVVSLLHKRRPESRIGVVARACDVRALVEMAKRKQVDPERLHIIGVACDSGQAEECFCDQPAPVVADWPHAEQVGTPGDPAEPNPLVQTYEDMALEERWAFWEQQFQKCIKCYGCRNNCPVCFCEQCALEDPLWVEKGVLSPPFPMFHLIKAMHMAGRCVACRQCELTCPAHIPLTVLYDLIRRDVEQLLGYVPGRDLAAGPPLSLTLDDIPLRAKVV
jgi:ferredoxin